MVSTKNVLKFIALRNARRGGGCFGCALWSVTRGGGGLKRPKFALRLDLLDLVGYFTGTLSFRVGHKREGGDFEIS